MTELKALKLVTLEIENVGYDNSPKAIKLKNEFKWFLSEEFKRLREGFVPEKFEEECKEKSPPPTLKKYDDGEDFDFEYLKQIAWNEFEQLESIESTSMDGYVLVNHWDLRNALLKNPIIVSMKATEIIVDRVINAMRNEGTLSMTKEGWYYRSTKDDESNTSAAVAAA
jgi:hypothetical protein